jgi:hypothetical protein
LSRQRSSLRQDIVNAAPVHGEQHRVGVGDRFAGVPARARPPASLANRSSFFSLRE